MDLKKTMIDLAAKEAANKILPMDESAPKLGKKAKLAALLGTIAAIAAAGSHYLGG